MLLHDRCPHMVWSGPVAFAGTPRTTVGIPGREGHDEGHGNRERCLSHRYLSVVTARRRVKGGTCEHVDGKKSRVWFDGD